MTREFKDRVQDTTQTTGTGAFVLDAAAIAGFRTFGSAHAVGVTLDYFAGSGAEWEVGTGTLTDATHLARTPTASSNGGGLVNFSAGSKIIFETVNADSFSRLMGFRDLAFSTALPFDFRGETYMPQQTMSGPLALTVGAGAVKGAYVYGQIIGDGTNTPTFAGFKQAGGSADFDPRAGIPNKFAAWYDGFDRLIYWNQTVGASAVDGTPPSQASAAVASATPTTVTVTCSEALDSGFVPAASAFTIAGHTPTGVGVAGSTFTLTVPAFVNAEAARTLAYVQPGTNGIRDLAGNLLASFSGLAITNNVGVTPTVPGTPAAPTATGGTGAASVAFVLPSAGTGTISSLAFTPYLAGVAQAVQTTTTLTSPFNAAGLGAGNYTFSFHAVSNVGNGGESPASNSVTVAAATSVLRLGTLSAVTESGSAGAYVYTGTGGGFGSEGRSILNKAFQNGVDGEYIVQQLVAAVDGGNKELFIGVSASNSSTGYTGLSAAVVGHPEGGHYTAFSNGNAGNVASFGSLVSDYVKVKRVGSTLTFDVSRNAGSTWSNAATFTGVSTGVLYIHNLLAGAMQIQPISSSGLA